MRKFTKYNEDSINENKVYTEYMRLSDILLSNMKTTLTEEGIELTDEIEQFLIGHCDEISKGAIDPSTILPIDGEQTELDFDTE